MDSRLFLRVILSALLAVALALPCLAQDETGQDPQAEDELTQTEITAKVAQTPEEAPPPAGLPQEEDPVRVTSDRMVYNEEEATVSFVGNVVAVHAGLNLTSKTIVAYFATGNKGAEHVERIVAEGDVYATYGTTKGTCDTLVYTVADGILRMEGDPMLQDGPNSVTGEVIKFYLRENRSEVQGGKSGQVEAVFTLPESSGTP